MIFLPGQERVVAEITNDLVDGTTNIILIPRSVNLQEVEYSLGEGLSHGNQYLHSGSLVMADCKEQSPVLTLSTVFEIDWVDPYAPRTVQNLIRNEGLPDIIFLRTFADASVEHRSKWLACIIEFSEIRTKDRVKCPVFCVVAQAADPTFKGLSSKLGLKIRYWYNLCSYAEAQSYYQTTVSGLRAGEHVWKAALLASLAGSDYDLARDLGDVVLRSTSEIFRRMGIIAAKRSWRPDELRREGVDLLLNTQLYVPLERLERTHPIRNLWNLGLVDYSHDHGWEIPSWVLALLDCRETFEHRIWRAQVEVVMPIINQLRLLAIQDLLRNHGTNWLTWPLPNQEGEMRSIAEPFQAEPAFLRDLLFYHEQKLQKEQDFLPAITQALLLRNRLAHYGTIEFVEYLDLLENVNGLRVG